MGENWTPEQIAAYRQQAAIIYGNLPPDTPPAVALKTAKQRARAFVEDPELFPPAVTPDPV